MSSRHRQILRATGIIGGASAANILIGLFRNKVAALVLGPVGIGLVGIFHNLVQTAAVLAALGIGNVGTRQLAEAGEDAQAQAIARRALVLAAAALALGGGLLLFLLRRPVAEFVLANPGWADEVGWLALGVTLLVGTVAQNGLLTGMRRIGDLARVSMVSALLGTVTGVGALLLWGERALLAFVLLSPLATFLVGGWYVRRLPRPAAAKPPLRELMPQWRTLARLGFAFTLGSVVGTAGQLAVRSLVQRELGAEALGHFQASWTISLNYIGFILTAMAADYYPRLTAAMRDRREAAETVNHQAEIALLLGGPVLVGTVALAPWIVQLLYSSKFAPAAELLRWQIAGDLLKIASWPMGFVLLAGGRGRAFVLVELMGALIMVGVTALAIPAVGLAAPGIGYLAAYVGYALATYLLARRIIGFTIAPPVRSIFAAVAAALAATALLTGAAPVAGAIAGVLLAAALGWIGAVRLQHALPGPLSRLIGYLPGAAR